MIYEQKDHTKHCCHWEQNEENDNKKKTKEKRRQTRNRLQHFNITVSKRSLTQNRRNDVWQTVNATGWELSIQRGIVYAEEAKIQICVVLIENMLHHMTEVMIYVAKLIDRCLEYFQTKK